MERVFSAGFFTFALAANLAMPVLAEGNQQAVNPDKTVNRPTNTVVNSDRVQAALVAPPAPQAKLSERDRIIQEHQTQRVIPQQ